MVSSLICDVAGVAAVVVVYVAIDGLPSLSVTVVVYALAFTYGIILIIFYVISVVLAVV